MNPRTCRRPLTTVLTPREENVKTLGARLGNGRRAPILTQRRPRTEPSFVASPRPPGGFEPAPAPATLPPMPWTPRRACIAPGCAITLAPGEQCPIHGRPPFAGSAYRHRRGILDSLRERIMVRDGRCCRLCGAPASVVDHIVPVAWGGSDDPSNLQALCRYHSQRKTAAESHARPRHRSR